MTPADRIKARMAELETLKANYLPYLRDRIREEDWHGAWDVCINLSEVSCERDGLRLALGEMEEGGPDLCPARYHSYGLQPMDGAKEVQCSKRRGHEGEHEARQTRTWCWR